MRHATIGFLTVLAAFITAPVDAAPSESEASETEASETEGKWVARGSVGRLWFLGRNSLFSNEAAETTTIRLEMGRRFGVFRVLALGQVSHINGVHPLTVPGSAEMQGDSLVVQLGVSGRVEHHVDAIVLGVYADLTATRIPLLMDRDMLEEDSSLSDLANSSFHEREGQLFSHAGLGLGGSLAVPIQNTGLSAEAQVGLVWITGVDLGAQTQIGLSASF